MAKAATKKAAPGAAGFASRLAKMQKVWEESSEASAGGGGVNFNVEDGKHDEARLVEAKIVEVKGGEKMMVEWTWDCLDTGDAAARKADPAYGYITSRDGLDTPQNLGHLKRKLKFFGFDHTQVKASELEEALKLITEGHPIATIRTWKSPDEQWQNQQLLGDGPSGWEADPWGGEAEELEETADELATLDRQGLLKYVAAHKAEFTTEVKVFKSDTDDVIRDKIRGAMPAVEEEEVAAEEEEEEEGAAEEEEVAVEIEKGTKVLYTPPRAKSALSCEVYEGPDAAGTVKLKNLESGKLLANRVAVDQLEVAAEESVEEEEVPAEEQFGTVKKGSKIQAVINGKPYKGVVATEPQTTDETLSVKFSEGPHKNKVVKVPIDDCEPLE